MIQFIWNWVLSWVFGWGGIAAVVCIAAWITWFLSPLFKAQLLHVAIGATIFTVASTYFFSSGYDKGYSAAIAAIARADQDAINRVKDGIKDLVACRVRGGTWDVTTGTCK